MRLRLRLFVADEYKPLRQVPPVMWLLTLGMLAAQIAFAVLLLPPPEVRQSDYTPPPSTHILRAAALGEPETLAKLLVLNLQAFDNQPGVSVPFAELDYAILGDWLDRIVDLDPRAEYPHFLMAKVYAVVNDVPRRRLSAVWVWRQFLNRPDDRWWWMAHGTNFTKHILKDDAMALEMARDLRRHTTPGQIPNWPRQMEAFFLENQDEFDAAAAILFNQLEAGEITDPQEFQFLVGRLEGILRDMLEAGKFASERQFQTKLTQLEQLHQDFLSQFDNLPPPAANGDGANANAAPDQP